MNALSCHCIHLNTWIFDGLRSKCIVQPIGKVLFNVNDEISSDYVARFFDTSLWHKQVAERAEEGARNHGLLNIGADEFMSIDIISPKLIEEQQKIADFFTSLDAQISLQTQRLEKLKQIKSACLDNMFV